MLMHCSTSISTCSKCNAVAGLKHAAASTLVVHVHNGTQARGCNKGEPWMLTREFLPLCYISPPSRAQLDLENFHHLLELRNRRIEPVT